MSPSELAELFDANPTAAFRLTLSSGDTVEVLQPARALIESSVMYVGQYDRGNARVAKGTRIVSIPNIALVEQMDPRRPTGSRRARP